MGKVIEYKVFSAILDTSRKEDYMKVIELTPEVKRKLDTHEELVEAVEHYYKAFNLRHPDSKFTNNYLEKLLTRAKAAL